MSDDNGKNRPDYLHAVERSRNNVEEIERIGWLERIVRWVVTHRGIRWLVLFLDPYYCQSCGRPLDQVLPREFTPEETHEIVTNRPYLANCFYWCSNFSCKEYHQKFAIRWYTCIAWLRLFSAKALRVKLRIVRQGNIALYMNHYSFIFQRFFVEFL